MVDATDEGTVDYTQDIHQVHIDIMHRIVAVVASTGVLATDSMVM